MVNVRRLKRTSSRRSTNRISKAVCGVFSEVPADRSDINDYNAMTTTKQFFTKVHAVYEGGHTLDVWTDLNSDGDKCWWACDYGDRRAAGDYAYEPLRLRVAPRSFERVRAKSPPQRLHRLMGSTYGNASEPSPGPSSTHASVPHEPLQATSPVL